MINVPEYNWTTYLANSKPLKGWEDVLNSDVFF